jgi:hypothetical protein
MNTSLEYNTQKDELVIREYGRNVQNMIKHCKTIEDAEDRNKCAQALIKVMGQLNPHLRDVEDFTHKLWAHLFILADFDLDVESPYPIPSRESIVSKPGLMDYPQSEIKYGHYGKLAEEWIAAAVAMEEGDEKQFLVNRLANMLKASYLIWNKDAVENSVIIKHLSNMSDGKLIAEENTLVATNELLKKFNKYGTSSNNNRIKSNNNNNNKRTSNYSNKNKQRKKY